MQYTTFVKEHRTLFVAGMLALFVGAVYRFYPAVGQMFPQQDETELKLKRIVKYQQKVHARDTLQTRQVALTRRLDHAERALLDAGTPALAAVDIQNIINEIIYANNLYVGSIRVLKAKDAQVEGYLAVPVQVILKLTVSQMRDLLYRIESADQLLAVTALSLRRLKAQEPDMLNATLTVEGYMIKRT